MKPALAVIDRIEPDYTKSEKDRVLEKMIIENDTLISLELEIRANPQDDNRFREALKETVEARFNDHVRYFFKLHARSNA